MEAAGSGHLEILQWVRSNGCPWDGSVCSYAASHDHLEVLKWTSHHGCPWSRYTCQFAAGAGHWNILQWAREHGCPWDESVCNDAASQGHFEAMIVLGMNRYVCMPLDVVIWKFCSGREEEAVPGTRGRAANLLQQDISRFCSGLPVG